MAEPIIGGPNRPNHDKPVATSGGTTQAKELPYSPPVGPSNQHQSGPGIHGDNHGCCGTQGKH